MTRILVLEDDPTMRSLLKTLLELENHIVAMPDTNGVSMRILEQIVIFTPSVILMDLNLEGADGMQLLQTIRRISNFDHIIIIISSGMDRSAECFSSGANHFLLKPYMPQSLLQLING
jgi:CheY-like chemotaxis protein